MTDHRAPDPFGPDPLPWLREELDRELDDVRSAPAALREVLDRARAEVPWWRGRVGSARVPAWFLAAAAVLVVGVAVPVGVGDLLRPSGPPDRLAGSALGTAPAGGPALAPSTSPVPTLSPTGSPTARPRPVRTTTPTGSAPVLKSSPRGVAPTAAVSCVPASVSIGSRSVPVDVDGDGLPDRLSLAPGSPGTLAVDRSRAGLAQGPFTTAGPDVQVLPVETDGTPGAELLVLTRADIDKDGSAGTAATLYDVQGCALGPVLNAQGRPYVFEVGSSQSDTVRAGVACLGGTLFGVTSVLDPATGWVVTRTPVSSADGRARNGKPVQSGLAPDDPTADALRLASCGTVTPQSLG